MSAISFACPNCGRTIKAKAENAGKRGKCPGCTSAIVVPSVGHESPQAPEAKSPAASPRRMPTWAYALIGGGVIACVFGGVAVGFLIGKGSESGAAVAATAENARPAADVASTPEARKTATISGAAWLTRNSGNSEILRGLGVILLPEEVAIGDYHLELIEETLAAAPENAKKARERVTAAGDDFLVQYIDKDEQTCAELLTDVREKRKQPDATYPLFELGRFFTALSNALEDIDQREATEMRDLFRRTLAYGAVAAAKTSVDGKYEIGDVPTGKYVLYSYTKAGVSNVEWAIPLKVNGEDVSADLYNGTAAEISEEDDYSLAGLFLFL